MPFSPNFIIEIITTFGLSVLLVLYFVFFYLPKRNKISESKYNELSKSFTELSKSYVSLWEGKYNDLTNNFDELSESYIRLEKNLQPESRMCSYEQAIKLADIGLDRDLYKLYYYMCEKIEGRRREEISFFIEDSIRITNSVWSKFKSPFPKVPHIGDLYGVYSTQENSLEEKLKGIFNTEKLDNDQKKEKIWNYLVNDTKNMKREFDKFILKLKGGHEIISYKERK